MPTNVRKEVTIIMTKKRRTHGELGSNESMVLNTEVMIESDEKVNTNIEQIGPNNNTISKNGKEAST